MRKLAIRYPEVIKGCLGDKQAKTGVINLFFVVYYRLLFIYITY